GEVLIGIRIVNYFFKDVWVYWFSEDLDISFLLIQRCIAQSGPLNYFGFCNIFFDKWTPMGDKAGVTRRI
ncbi:MAG: hypothetical protein ABJB86_04665, partial [Bacteroidota bacterium]